MSPVTTQTSGGGSEARKALLRWSSATMCRSDRCRMVSDPAAPGSRAGTRRHRLRYHRRSINVPYATHVNPSAAPTTSDTTRIPARLARATGIGVWIVMADQRQPEGTEQVSRHEVPAGSLKARLRDELTEAMKAGQKVRLSALRMLSSAVTNRETEVMRPLTDEEFVEVANREVKKRREAAEAFAGAGREDRAATEREEQAVLEAYLPAGLTDTEVDSLIERAVADTGATGPGDLGAVMRLVMAEAKGRADGQAVQAKVRARLGG